MPPVTAAAARKGAALDRSGSTVTSRALISLGSTRQVSGSASSTTTPASRRASTVIWMWGRLGRGLPTWWIVTPPSKRAPDSSSAEMNWLLPEASTVTVPPRRPPRPSIVNGIAPRPPSSIVAPRERMSWVTSGTTSMVARSVQEFGSPELRDEVVYQIGALEGLARTGLK